MSKEDPWTAHRLANIVIAGFVIILLAMAIMRPAAPSNAAQLEPEELAVYTDALTGCQYLGMQRGRSLTARLNHDGKAICKTEPAPITDAQP